MSSSPPSSPSVADLGTFLYKIVMLGASGAGKTSLLSRFGGNDFDPSMKSTIGVEFATSSVEVESGSNVKVQIWDTAGQERYRAIASAYYRGAVGALLVFDLSNRGSFDALSMWYKEMMDCVDQNIVIGLIGNKADLVGQRQVTTEEAQLWAEAHNMSYIEASAKNNDNVAFAFHSLVSEIHRVRKPSLVTSGEGVEFLRGSGAPGSTVKLSAPKDEEGESTKQTRADEMKRKCCQ
jgi:small GTP-binding protein